MVFVVGSMTIAAESVRRLDPFQRRLLEAAIRAPSGDNCQPWAFHFADRDRLAVHIVPERAKSFFDFQHRATYLSVGAVIENIRIRAGSEGVGVQVSYRTHTAAPVAAVLTLVPGVDSPVAPQTVEALFRRTVNRRPYLVRRPPDDVVARLMKDPIAGTAVRVVRSRREMAQWAAAITLADRIRFSHPVIHEELFAKLLFTKQAAHEIRMGLEVDRLGLGPAGAAFLRVLRPWRRVERLSRWGLIRLLAAQSGLLAKASGVLVLVTTKGRSAEDWMRAGEQVQRLWIRAQEEGWQTHPLPVGLYLDQRFQEEGMSEFLPSHARLLQSLRRQIGELVPEGLGAMLFRMGRAPAVGGTSVRRPIEEMLV